MKGHRQWAFSLPPISSSSSSPSSSSASCASSASHYYHHASGRPAPHHSRLRSSCILSLSSCPSTGHSPRRNGRRRRGRRFLACPVRDRRTRGTGEGCVPEHSPSLLTWFPAFSPFSVRPSLYNSFSCMYNVSSSFCSSSSPKLRSFLHASTSSRTNLFSSSRGVRLSSSSPPRSSHTSSSSSTFLSLRNHLPLKPCRFFSLSPSCYSFSSFSSSHSIPGEQPGPKSDGGRRAWGEEEDEKEKSTGGSENTEWSIEKRTKKEKEKKESTGGEFACSFSLSSAKNPRLSDEEYVRKLGDELHAIDTEKLLPDRMQYLHKERLLAILGPLLKQHTGGSLIPFGSCANGFWTRGSDIDSCLVLPGCEGRALQRTKLRVVKEVIERHGMGKATVVPAQVPIAKVYNAKGEGLVDVSVNNCAALENSMLIQTFGEIDARVRPLGRFIKYWAKQRNINNRSEGTLSTYTLMLQLIFFLQTRSPPILPSYQSIELCKATSGGISSTPNQFSPASLPAPSSSSSPPSSISEGQALSLQTEERCRNSSSSSYEKRSSETVMDDKIEKERERGRGHERREAGEKREDKGVIIPAEGLRPLPFSMDSQRIRRELIEKYGENKESLGQLIRDFFLFYGDRKKSSILGSRDGALVVIEVYDASVSIHDAEYTDLLPPDNAAIRSILSSHSMTPSSFSSSPSFSSPSDTSASLSPSSSPSSGNLSPPSEGLVSATSSAPIRDEMGDTFRCLSGHPDRTCVDEGKTLFSVDMCSDSEESGREKKEEIKSHGELRRGRRYEDDYMEEEEEKRKKDAGTEEEEEESEAYDDEHDERREEEFFSFFHKKNRRLVMKCPLTRQIVNRFSSSAWEIICSEFQRAEHLLRHQQGSLEDICLPASLSHRQTKKLSRLQRRNMIRSLALSRGLLVSTGFVDSATEGQLKEDLKKTSGGERRRHDTPISSPGFSCDSYSRSEHRYEIDSHVSLSMKIENRTAVCATPTTSDVSPSLTPPRVSSRRLAVSSNEIFHPVPSPSHTDTACHNSDGNLSARVSTYSHDKRDWEEEKGTNEVRKFSTGSLFISSLSPSSSPFSSSTSPRSFVRHDKTDHTLHYRKTPASCISVQTQQLSLHLPHGGPRASHQTTALRVGSINGKAAVDGDEKKRNRSLALLSVNRRDQTRRTSLKNSSSVISSSSSSSTLSYVSGRGVGFSDLSQSCRNSDDGGFTCNQPGGGCYYRERSPCIPSSEEKQKHAVPRNIGDGHKVGGDTGSLSHSRLTMSMGPEKLNRDESLALRHSNGTAYMKEKDGGDKEDVDVLLHELQIAQWKLRTQLEEHLRSLRYQFYRVLQNSAVTTSNDNNSATIAPLQ